MGSRKGFHSREEKAQEEKAEQYKVWGLIGLGTVAVLVVGFFGYRYFFGGSGFVGRELTSGEENIKKIAYMYSQYTGAKGKPPANVDELKAWAKTLSKAKQTDLGIDDVEKAFTSPRDNQPYVVVPLRADGMKPDLVIAYEKTGAGGKRWGVSGMGSAWEIGSKNSI
jgi:hypothetical protein